MSLVFGNEFLAQGHTRDVQLGLRTWLSADQSSSSTLTESSFLFDPCLLHRGTVTVLGKVTFKSNALQYCVTP